MNSSKEKYEISSLNKAGNLTSQSSAWMGFNKARNYVYIGWDPIGEIIVFESDAKKGESFRPQGRKILIKKISVKDHLDWVSLDFIKRNLESEGFSLS